MFRPTHALISRSGQTPVQLLPAPQGFCLLTEAEFQQGKAPAFEIRPRLGLFCRNIPIVGYRLEPLAVSDSTPTHSPRLLTSDS